MDISLDQIYEYNQCPMIYKFKSIMKIDRSPSKIEKEYHGAIRKAIMFFYYQILNGKQVPFEVLRQKFGSILYKDLTTKDILSVSTLDKNLNALSYTGIKTLMNFYERESNKEFVPIAVDMDVKVPVGENHVLFTIDLVREINVVDTKLIEIVKFTNPIKKIDAFYINHDLALTLHSYAFRKLFEATENRLVLQHMKSGKEFYTLRKEHEFKRLGALVTGVCDSIKREQFYPVHNVQCNSCMYRDLCDKYKF